jgi:hypothetical protein
LSEAWFQVSTSGQTAFPALNAQFDLRASQWYWTHMIGTRVLCAFEK